MGCSCSGSIQSCWFGTWEFVHHNNYDGWLLDGSSQYGLKLKFRVQSQTSTVKIWDADSGYNYGDFPAIVDQIRSDWAKMWFTSAWLIVNIYGVPYQLFVQYSYNWDAYGFQPKYNYVTCIGGICTEERY